MSTYAVQVSSISAATTERHLHDFFSFCGKISSIDYSPDSQSATIHFEKPSAAKTALMLNGGSLDGTHLHVSSEIVHPDHDDEKTHHHDGTYEQSDKPRAAIAAEYLARGYSLSDQILQRAIELDSKQGISTRFLSYIQTVDTTLGARALGPEKTISGKVQETLTTATQQARTLDEQKGISKQASDYYTRALSSPWGQKVKAFYTTTSKQIYDIHDEARRIADTQKAAGQTPHSTGAGTASPPLDPVLHTAPGSAGAGITGAEFDPKTAEAPTIV
ncbi:hypothetical protein B0H21DRAFT_334589 [Amylocystis lapponica]|nr:hypothetical protein B0H21DRAFT_334589 [Amylocystis lapponica]